MTNHPYIYVYQTICEINGKSYIGVHKTNNINDGYIGCGVFKPSDAWRKNIFHRAVKKHGYTSFRRYILSFYDTYQEALDDEKYMVNERWVKDKNNYNCAIGGKGSAIAWMSEEEKKEMYSRVALKTKGLKRSKEFCENLSKLKTGKKLSATHVESLKRSNARYWLGKKRSADSIKKTADAIRGMTRTEEQKKLLSDAHKGQVSANRKKVIQITKYGCFIKEHLSLSHAAKELGCLRTSISNNLSGLTTSCGGFIFKYKEEAKRDC